MDASGQYNVYRIPNPQAPYPQDYIIDQEGKVAYWAAEYDPQEIMKVIDRLLIKPGRQCTPPYRGPVLSIGPNPANPLVVASFELRVASNLSLDIFDICGRRLVELASGLHLPGEYRYVWDASKNASGIYFVRLKTLQATTSQKLTIVK